MAPFKVKEGGASPQSPLDMDSTFDNLGYDTKPGAFPSCLLSYSEETAYILDAPPSGSSCFRAGTSNSGDLGPLDQCDNDQGLSRQEEVLSKLLAAPPGRLAFFCDPSEQHSKAGVQASTLFGALHHARAFDSKGESQKRFHSLALSIPSLEELPPDELLDLAAQDSRSFPQEDPPSERDENGSWNPTAPQDLDSASIDGSKTVAGANGVFVPTSSKTKAETTSEGGNLPGDTFATWLAAAVQPPAGPIAHSWEEAEYENEGEGLSHKRAKEQGLPAGAFVSEQGVEVFDQAYRRYASKALCEPPLVVQEYTLVRDALYALQGVPSSLIRLESQTNPPPKQGAQRPPQVRLASTGPSSIKTLLKPLLEAGRLRQQLEAFAQGKTGPPERGLSSTAERGLVLQAFGGALQTVLLCQTAALDRIGQSVRARRARERPRIGTINGDDVTRCKLISEREPEVSLTEIGNAVNGDNDVAGRGGTEPDLLSRTRTEPERNGTGTDWNGTDWNRTKRERNGTELDWRSGNGTGRERDGTETELLGGNGTAERKRNGKRKNLEAFFAAAGEGKKLDPFVQERRLVKGPQLRHLSPEKGIADKESGFSRVAADDNRAIRVEKDASARTTGETDGQIKPLDAASRPAACATNSRRRLENGAQLLVDVNKHLPEEHVVGADQLRTGVKGLTAASDGVNRPTTGVNGLSDDAIGLPDGVDGFAVSVNGLADRGNDRSDALTAIPGGVNALSDGVNRLSDGGGTLTSNNVGDLTLLELLLHSHELRTQLRVLARLCRRLGGFGGSGELEEGGGGPELLSRLFDEVLNADPAHADVHRFLLSAACQPYLELVRAWLYQQPVEDPYHEFIMEQSDEIDPATGMKVFRTARPPSFLAEVWQPLIRAGQQLRVLLDLPQTRELAETILSRPDWRPAQTLNPSHAKPPISGDSLDALHDSKHANHAGYRSPGGGSGSGHVSSPGLVFGANRLRVLAAEGRERARKKEIEAGWTLTMLAMQERRRREGKLDSIERRRLEMAKSYDEQRLASWAESERERKRKEALLKSQREEIERRAEATRRAAASRVARERALLREEEELERAEVARAKAAMVAEAEGQLADLDRRIREAEQRTAAANGEAIPTEAVTGSVTLSQLGGSPEADVTAGYLRRPAVVTGDWDAAGKLLEGETEDPTNETSPVGSDRNERRKTETVQKRPGSSSDSSGQRPSAANSGEGFEGIDLDEWHRLAQLETSDSGLFGSEGGIRPESSAEASLGGVSPSGGSVREEDSFEGVVEDGPGVSSDADTLSRSSRRLNAARAHEGGIIATARSGTGVASVEKGETLDPGDGPAEDDDVSTVLKNLILDLEEKNREGFAAAEKSGGEVSGPAEVDHNREAGESGRGAVHPVSRWGPPEDFARSAGVAREGLEVSASAREAALTGRELEGREMRDVMDGGFGGFHVGPRWDERETERNITVIERITTPVRWGASGDFFPAAGMSTRALGDVFAAQDFRFVGGVDSRDRGHVNKHRAEGSLRNEAATLDPVSSIVASETFGTDRGLANDGSTRVLENEPSREALAFLSPIPSGSGTPTQTLNEPATPSPRGDRSPTTFATPSSRGNRVPTTIASPVAPTGRRQSSPSDAPTVPAAQKTPQTGRPGKEEPGDDSDAPLSVVLDVCVVREILAQYRCVSLCCVRVFQEELELPAHCSALRRYLFMLAGDFADAFVAALLNQEWGPSGGASRQAEVQALLESSLQTSSCSGDKFAERLHVRVEQSPEELQGLPDVYAPWVKASLTPGGFVDLGRVDAFDFIQLEYHVDWPLTLVLTSAAIKQYQAVFQFLLRAKHATFSLRDVWRDLQVLSRRLAKRGPGVSAHVFSEQQRQLREAQLFRQAISHVVTTLASFVQAQLLDVAWTRYQERVRTEVVDLHDLRQVHSEYLTDATRHCLMGADDAAAKAHIDAIFQQLLDFRRHLRRAVRTLDQPAAELEIDEVNQQIKQTKEAFQESFRTLYAVHLRPQAQNTQAVGDLCMRLDFNGFVEEQLAR